MLFPDAQLVPVEGLLEMCFGIFEGRNYVGDGARCRLPRLGGRGLPGPLPRRERRGASFPTGTCAAFAPPGGPMRWREEQDMRRSSWRTGARRWRLMERYANARAGLLRAGARATPPALCWMPGAGSRARQLDLDRGSVVTRRGMRDMRHCTGGSCWASLWT